MRKFILSFFSNKIIKLISLSVLFLISSLCFFYGLRFLVGVATSLKFSDYLLFLSCSGIFLPLFIFIVLSLTKNNEVKIKKSNLILMFGSLISGFTGIFSLVLHFILFFDCNFAEYLNNNFHYFELLFFNILSLFLSILFLFITISLNKENFNQNSNKEKSNIFYILFSIFTAYFTGEILFGVHYFFEPFSSLNWPLVLACYLIFISLPIELLFYHLSKNEIIVKNKKQKLISCFCLLLHVIILFTFSMIYMCVNPLAFGESLQYEFVIGIAIKFPLGLLLILAVNLLTILPTIYLIKKKD